MKTTIVCGLFGAGKTTFIQKFIQGTQERTAVLVNDFGKAGIDGEIISSQGIETVELPSGCVCCILKADLILTLHKIIKTFSPEHLIIEPSGIASPSGILETLNALGIDMITVVGIVDSTEFIDLYESELYGNFFEDQIRNSDIILVNKTDLAKEETIAATTQLLTFLNPGSIILPTVHAALDSPLPITGRDQSIIWKDRSHLHFDSIAIQLEERTDLVSLDRFFEDLARGEYGEVVRAKALVTTDEGPIRFDLSYGKADRSPFGKNITNSRLIVIGNKLDRKKIENGLPGKPKEYIE